MKRMTAIKKFLLKRETAVALGFVVLLIAIGLFWHYSPWAEEITAERVAGKMQNFKDHDGAAFIMIGVFILGGLCFFPLTALTIATAMTFGPFQGIAISLMGAICSAVVTYGLGFLLGKTRLRKWMGPLCDRLQKSVESTGVLGMTALRFVLVVPYTAGNMALGVLRVHFPTFIAGSFLALIPGAIIRSVIGDAMMDFWREPNANNTTYIIVGCTAWLLIVISSHALARKKRLLRHLQH